MFKLERSLHFLLAHYAVHFDHGDGRTEFFADGALAIALQHLDLFCNHPASVDTYKKGIERPPAPFRLKRRRSNYQARMIKKAKAVPMSVLRLAEKFARINRLLLMLKRRQSRIPYQYDIGADAVIFRITLPGASDAVLGLVSYFSFDIKDFNGWFCINCCTAFRSNDVTQFRITLPENDDEWPWGPLFYYFTRQSEGLLRALPQRSAAAIEPIPQLDEKSFWK